MNPCQKNKSHKKNSKEMWNVKYGRITHGYMNINNEIIVSIWFLYDNHITIISHI